MEYIQAHPLYSRGFPFPTPRCPIGTDDLDGSTTSITDTTCTNLGLILSTSSYYTAVAMPEQMPSARAQYMGKSLREDPRDFHS